MERGIKDANEGRNIGIPKIIEVGLGLDAEGQD